jgi:hypothetical protein
MRPPYSARSRNARSAVRASLVIGSPWASRSRSKSSSSRPTPPDHAVGHRQRAVARKVQRGLVRADRVDLVHVDLARQLVAEIERLHRPAAFDLVQPVANAVNCGSERVLQSPGVAVVVAVGQNRVLGGAVRLEECEPLGRDHRVDYDSLRLQVVRADLGSDPLADSRPVPKTRCDLVHSNK